MLIKVNIGTTRFIFKQNKIGGQNHLQYIQYLLQKLKVMNKLISVLTFFAIISVINCKGQSNFVTVAIVGTNDIHGSAFPTTLFRSDKNQTYTAGGLQIMASMIETIRSQYKGNFLYLDAGDQFQGGIESSPLVSSGEIMNDYYNSIKVDASAIGNHQFDFGQKFLFQYWNNRLEGSPNLAANLHSEKGEQEFLPKQKNIKLFQLQSGIKIGVIGLATIETPATTAAFASGSFPPYKFRQYKDIVIKNSKILRDQGADAVLIVSHVGNACNADNTYGIWDSTSFQKSTCDEKDEISFLINELPVGTIDGVVQGHRHKFSHHFIKGVPVMGTNNGGYYFNVLYLNFFQKKIYYKVIEGPVPVCQKIFFNNKRCSYLSESDLKTAGELKPWKFHGVQVKKHQQIKQLFQTKWLPKMSEFLQELTTNQLILQRDFTGESKLGNLVTDLINMAAPGNDFVIMNEGGFRTVWLPGILQYQHFYNMFPFTNTLITFQMTGQEIIKMLQIVQAGQSSFYPTKNFKQNVTIYSNGTRKLTSVAFADGTPIDKTKNYKGVSIQFLMRGGDDFKDVIGKVYTLRKQVILGEFRGLLKPQFSKYGPITLKKVIDPLNPRIIIDRV